MVKPNPPTQSHTTAGPANRKQVAQVFPASPRSRGAILKSAMSNESAVRKRLFLLSPANLSGRRAKALVRETANFELATRLRSRGAPLGDVFSFISGLYFRGKLAYANAFSQPAATGPSVLIITATQGLLAPEIHVNRERLEEMAQVPIDCSDTRYRDPLERDLARLISEPSAFEEVILLGSIATPKYLEPLATAFGEKLLVPADFIGRGDMSRGALMLRAVREGVQLGYMLATAIQIKKLKTKPVPNEPKNRKTSAKKPPKVAKMS
jgi:hypothetical protein